MNDLLMIVDLYVNTQGNWAQEDNFFYFIIYLKY